MPQYSQTNFFSAALILRFRVTLPFAKLSSASLESSLLTDAALYMGSLRENQIELSGNLTVRSFSLKLK